MPDLGFFQGEAINRALYNKVPVILYIADADGYLLDVNQYWLTILSYTRDEVIGKKIIDFMSEESRQYAKIYELPKFLNTDTATDTPYKMLKKNGETIDVMNSSILEHDQDGNPISLSVMHDITQLNMFKKDIGDITTILQQRQVELEAVNKELESFSYSVSHDLRSPLRSIDGFSALLMSACQNLDERSLDYLNRIRSASQRMDKLIDDLLKLSRLSRIEIRKNLVNLSEIGEMIISELRQKEPDRQVEVAIAPNIMAFGDSSLIQIALENLINNAWKFSSKTVGARIELGQTEVTHKDETKIAYYIKDNGAGFSMAHADKLFGAFQRLHEHTDFPGTGIGLATVRRVINRHSGDIWAESAVREGTTFYFTL